MTRSTTLLAAVVWLGLALAGARAVDFRVENKVFLDDEKEPRAQSTTLFCEGLVYDYLANPAEVTIFDQEHRRFVLLDTTRRVKTELSAMDLVGFNQNLRKRALQRPDQPLLAFMAAPKFESQLDPKTGEIVFTSPLMTYRVSTTEAKDPTIVAQYREFSDWYAMLNTRTNPGGKLPYPRLVVNTALAESKQLPAEVRLTMQRKATFARKTSARSQHQFIPALVESDRDRVTQTQQSLATFQAVSYEDYRKGLEER
jgi:hypothetical protein